MFYVYLHISICIVHTCHFLLFCIVQHISFILSFQATSLVSLRGSTEKNIPIMTTICTDDSFNASISAVSGKSGKSELEKWRHCMQWCSHKPLTSLYIQYFIFFRGRGCTMKIRFPKPSFWMCVFLHSTYCDLEV